MSTTRVSHRTIEDADINERPIMLSRIVDLPYQNRFKNIGTTDRNIDKIVKKQSGSITTAAPPESFTYFGSLTLTHGLGYIPVVEVTTTLPTRARTTCVPYEDALFGSQEAVDISDIDEQTITISGTSFMFAVTYDILVYYTREGLGSLASKF